MTARTICSYETFICKGNISIDTHTSVDYFCYGIIEITGQISGDDIRAINEAEIVEAGCI